MHHQHELKPTIPQGETPEQTLASIKNRLSAAVVMAEEPGTPTLPLLQQLQELIQSAAAKTSTLKVSIYRQEVCRG
nr:hypothetical protein [uncultured Holophaga sp.]